MKNILIASLALALPALASAQLPQLISGYNFGQFIGAGYPALDGTTGDAVGSIGSNYRLTGVPPNSSSGDFVGNNGLTGNYSNGFGRVYFDGTNGSSNYNTSNGTSIYATDTGANSVNGNTVYGTQMFLQGDGLNLALTSNVNGASLSFVQNTLGYADFTSGSVSNLTFAGQSSSAATISWSLLGSSSVIASTTIAAGGSFASYAVDLPADFFGVSAATLVATISGSAPVSFDNVQFNATAIPEPGTYAAILGALTIGVVAIRRRKDNVLA